ncbi:interferon-induced very large GTPase 1-like [Callorhinchus milii]|uniref:interferon-induced very large GTPase 1-like n=1 Tax=Callorhinchus milii TaxID=7868 RepID=UPI0004573F06|nr:interferon-induced very large GTPase 1-like [Callorhinchus milii]XP_042191119.1 interferon-induced very large GTPase 1-like [Callorhinchus milii]|eukprot:gi/632985465/ref/XP_007909699.1/ PREDICTED: interferon-induced very large GTPase 1-like [Callorhinchus milii]
MESSIEERRPVLFSNSVELRLDQLLTDLGLRDFYPNKLSLNNVLELGKEPFMENRPIAPQEIPRYFLRMVMKADTNARALPIGTILDCAQEDRKATDGLNSPPGSLMSQEIAFHPLDVITAVFLCADPSLQRELLSKMSMSHFALPLLLPGLGESPMFLLGPLCSIVTKYHPQAMKLGPREQHITNAKLPTIAFLRLGRCSMSKSKLLNDILSQSEQHHNFFIHSNMECADVPRRISDGLIEVCWYLPGVTEELKSFPKALAVMNLHGDAKQFPKHVSYLTRISAVVVVCVDNVDNKVQGILTSLIQSPEKLVMLINPNSSHVEVTQLNLKKLFKHNFLSEKQIVSKSQKTSGIFIQELRSKLEGLLGKNDYPEKSLEEMAEVARDIGFAVSEHTRELSEGERPLNDKGNALPTESLGECPNQTITIHSLKKCLESRFEIGMKHVEEQSIQNYFYNEKPSFSCVPDTETNVSCKDSVYNQLLTDLGLQEYFPQKLTVNKVLEVRAEPLPDRLPRAHKDIPWYFFRKLITANSTARCIKLTGSPEERSEGDEVDNLFDEPMETLDFNPLDVITAIFLCADPFLKQELVMKMSTCQFAVPLLLPGTEGKILFLLNSMRSLVKKWCPSQLAKQNRFKEAQMMSFNLPSIAFIRLGRCSMSKSKYLNDILSPSQQHNDFFIHCNMECANVPRKVSDGLIEVCWYLPGVIEEMKIFPKALTVMNLRGDAAQFTSQVKFLTRVSTAVFICVDNITEKEVHALSKLSFEQQKLYLIVNPEKDQVETTKQHLRRLSQEKRITMNHVLLRRQGNDATFVQNVQKKINTILDNINGQSDIKSLAEMASCAWQVGLEIDEDDNECKEGKTSSGTVLRFFPTEDIAEFKQSKLYFQGKDWMQISKIEEEICCLRNVGQQSVATYIDKQKKQIREIRKELFQKGVSDVVEKMIQKLATNSGNERKHFLYLMKYELDSMSWQNLTKKQQCESSEDQKAPQDLDVQRSLGLEHFLREIGLVYETFMALNENSSNITKLPVIAAELLLDGFPLELIDGDVCGVAVDWVTEVLKQVEKTKGGECRVFVLTVLGVQSTGKSTLLNTMFGLQFAVGSGRCTRGAFIQLIPIVGDLKTKLGCDFILVIDTEGLKQQVSDIGGTHEHDNELATLVIGMSDLTLINMSMESPSEMEDVLQIVVHAFIRMSEVGKKPICQFVHQNTGDVSAHEQNLGNRKRLNDRLDKMTSIAAKIEKVEGSISKFSNVIDYNPDKDNWYIPGLWHGNPPMAAVNIGYSQKLVELKQCVLEKFTQRNASTVTQFIRNFTNLWNAVKHENFIFSFRNCLEVDAYNDLSVKYSDLEWELRKKVYDFVDKAQERIKTEEKNPENLLAVLRNELLEVMETTKAKVIETLEHWFSAQNKKAHLIQDYKDQFKMNIDILCKKLNEDSQEQMKNSMQRQEGRKKLQAIKNQYNKVIEDKVTQLVQSLKQKTKDQDENEQHQAFETMWAEATSPLKVYEPKVANIPLDMEISLKENVNTHRGSLYKNLKDKSLDEWGKLEFKVNEEHIAVRSLTNRAWRYMSNILYESKQETEFLNCCVKEAQEQAEILILKSKEEMEKTIQQDMNYDPKYCKTILRNLDIILDCDFPRFSFTETFRTSFKLHICGIGVQRFQQIHNSFRQKNDPLQSFEADKKFYKQIFVNLYNQKDQSQSCAELYLNSYIKPAMIADLNQKLGRAIVDYIKSTQNAEEFKSRRNLQVGIMLDLKKKNCFEDYYQYIKNTHKFEKDWVEEQVLRYCENSEQEATLLHNLAMGILEPAVHSIQKAIRDIDTHKELTAWTFLTEFRKAMEGIIVLPQDKFTNQDIVRNAPCFVDELKDLANGLKNDLSNTIKGWNVRSKVSELPVAPWKLLYDMLSGCGEQCPYCGVLCDCTDHNHEKHSANYHLPEGLRGYRWSFWKTLVTNSCSDTSYIALRLYREEDPWLKSQLSISHTWVIPKSRDTGVPPYWKRVFYTHNKSFAKKYGVNPATRIDDWNVPWSEIKKDIEEKYNVRIDDFPASLQPL